MFNTLFAEPGSAGIDALAQSDWDTHINYCFPPVAMIGRVMNFLLHVAPGARVILIFPFWVSQPWFNLVAQGCNKCYKLPLRGNALFTKVHKFACKPAVRQDTWEFCVGYRNLPIITPPNWAEL